MNNEITFKELLKRPSLSDEWTYIINSGGLSEYPPQQWDNRLCIKESAFPKERTESFLKCIDEYADLKERGEAERRFIYSEAEMAADETKRRVAIYLRLQSKAAPLALIVPGGAYAHVSVMNEGFPIAHRLFERGYSTAVLLYRVGESASNVRPLLDLEHAVKFLGERSENLSLWGFSAGGHLCGCYCGLAKTRGCLLPRSLVLGYPVISLCDNYAHRFSRTNFFGHEPTELEKDAYSAEKLVTRNYPPTYLWHCEDDKTVSVENSRIFCESLERASIKHLLRIFPNGSHGLGAAVGLLEASWLDEAIDFCDKFNK